MNQNFDYRKEYEIVSRLLENYPLNVETRIHMQHVPVITQLLLKEIRGKISTCFQQEEEINLIGIAATLHDIGKTCIPDCILNKPGRLTCEEFKIIKEHTVAGNCILRSLADIKSEPVILIASNICRWHHERWDGSGYPDGLCGKQIPVCAQIVSLVDVYDALTSDRCYKKAYTHSTAVQMILQGECGVFNPELLQCFLNIEDKIENLKKFFP